MTQLATGGDTPTQIRPASACPANRVGSVDKHVGQRIRDRRVMLGLSQQQMAEMIGVTYQQAHKYARGINRISAGRLFEIGRALSVPIAFFYEGLDGAEDETSSHRHRMCLELARNFASISNEKHQEAISQLARTLADQQ
ncbi:MAG: helix-turn-helix transcriptional regulator [Alphaproteobacteria bacterium]|nr:helix-turn-helix transcriptional regulator [Alphaproteobacteria bacterium]